MEDNTSHLDFIEEFLPKYLTVELKEKLFSDIHINFPYSTNSKIVYQDLTDTSIYYQGDGVDELVVIQYNELTEKFEELNFPASIISNTCDIDPNNSKEIGVQNVIFSCIYNLADYIKELEEAKIAKEKIESFLTNLKSNTISNLFYLPKLSSTTGVNLEESFIRFDQTFSHPVTFLQKGYNKNYFPNGDRLFTLSNYGFYLFIFKLSVHFCRFREGVFRNA